MKTPYGNDNLPEPDDWEDDPEFNPCARCDGHPACEDFGCAIELGLGRMVKKDITKDWDQ